MKLTDILAVLLAAVGAMCLAGIPPLFGAEAEAALESAWLAIDLEAWKDADRSTAMLNMFRLGSPEVDAFFVKRLEGHSNYKMGWREEAGRIMSVMKVNAERGCLWLIARSRSLSLPALSAAEAATFSCPDYQEDYQFGAGLLGDTRVFSWQRGPLLAPDVVYRTRMCDSAYGRLGQRLAPCVRLATLAKEKGWQWPLAALPPAMSYEERDERIRQLVELLKSPAAKEYVASRPSALVVVSASGDMPDIVHAARCVLSVTRPQLMKPPLPKTTMIDLWENEYPPLDAQEETLRRRLIEKPLAEIVRRLTYYETQLPRNRDHVKWALAQRDDRMEIAKALGTLYQEERARGFSGEIIELAGELIRLWHVKDKPAAEELARLVREVSEDPQAPWRVKDIASDILSRR